MIPDNDINSDLAVLNERCTKNGMLSPVKFSWNGKPSIKNRIHINLYEVFKKELVKGTIFKNKYRTLKLEDVSQALLGKGKYGLGAVSGANAYTRSIEEQKHYVLQDAQLVMDLSKINNGQILSLMQAIAELTKLSLEQVCHNSISTWWTKVFDDTGCIPPKVRSLNEDITSQQQSSSDYQGGFVIEPKRGLYENIKVVDVVSLYPSIAILNNISFDTVNCNCCINREDAKVPAEVIDKSYWICKQRLGAFPRKLRQYKEERVRQKQLGNEVKQLGLKILINGGYGLFGNPVFKYADVRVAELITAYGRATLRYMQELAQSYGFEVIAGDTDSLFILDKERGNENLQNFINHCHQGRSIEVEHQRTFSKFLSIKKKHYIGIDSITGEAIVKGMEGKKSDRPRWVTRIFDQFVQDFKDGIVDPTINIKKAISDLESGRVDSEDLKIHVRLSKEPSEYPNNSIQKRVGLHLGSKKGDIIYYYKTAANGKKKEKDPAHVPINPEDIDITEYNKTLSAALKDALEILGVGEKGKITSDIFNIGSNSGGCNKNSKNMQYSREITAFEYERKEGGDTK
jgi:DNA polymerase, archaea type